jgi:alanine racemase
VRIHIKVDTGMTRIGYMYQGAADIGAAEEIERISKLPYLVIDGIFTHLACADEADDAYTRLQFGRFMELCDILRERGVDVGTRHVCNSAGLVMYPEMQLDMVRPGLILYGMHPSEITRPGIELTPAMSLKARVTMVKTVGTGIGVSYGKEYETCGVTKIATIPLGYADGYSRLFAGKAGMLCEGKFVRVIGRICMDQCMVDVTNVYNISEGDVVTVMGTSEGQTITADDLAGYMGTINYEVVCIIGKRIPRIYISEGKVVRAQNDLV